MAYNSLPEALEEAAKVLRWLESAHVDDSDKIPSGETLRHLREAANLSLRELGRQCDASVSHLSDIEHGRVNPSVPTLRRILAVYGLDIAIVKKREQPAESTDK